MENKLKHLLFTSVMLALMLLSLGAAANTDIPANHCLPLPGSKRYIDSDFSTPYPRQVKFECTYECKVKGSIVSVYAIQDVVIRNMEDDARLTACQGVQVKRVSWGYDFDKIIPFYAYDTKMIEMKRFAFESIDQKNSTETIYLMKLKNSLLTVANAYHATRVEYFVQAAKELERVATELPAKTVLLDKQIKEITRLKGVLPVAANAQGLVLMNINTHASWRIPIHLFSR